VAWTPFQVSMMHLFFFLLKISFYLLEREREGDHKQGEWQAEREGVAGSLPQGARCDAGLHPRTPGS